MKIILRDGNRYVIRIDRGEELIACLTNFCEAEKIEAGWFLGIGAASEIVISHYNINVKKYSDREIKEKLEIISLLGNIATRDSKIYIHTHSSLSDSRMSVRAGHVKKLVVGPTCEVFLIKLEGKIGREYSKEIGLNLMK